MDDFAKKEMQNEGIPADIIHSFGNPHFETIKNQARLVDIEKTRSRFLRNDLNKKL
jgi:hypothetical protein